jgi:hypothetical protein
MRRMRARLPARLSEKLLGLGKKLTELGDALAGAARRLSDGGRSHDRAHELKPQKETPDRRQPIEG